MTAHAYFVRFSKLHYCSASTRAEAENRARCGVEMGGYPRADVFALGAGLGRARVLLVTFRTTPAWVRDSFGRDIERPTT